MNARFDFAHIAQTATLVDYDPATGLFTRKVNTGSRWRAGQAAGTFDAKGYVILNVGGRRIKAHRLAWFIVHGELPELIDHINGDPADNRIANLRPASKRANCLNTPDTNSRNHRTGLRGVTKISGRSKRWAARIHENGRRVHLGSFATPEDAHAAYLFARQRVLAEALDAN